jgi:hypothetical protein
VEVLLDQLDKETWTEFLLRRPYSHFWQSWEWGEFLASFKHREILRFSIHDSAGDILGLISVCVQPFRRFIRRADSVPVSHFSGPIVREDLDVEVRKSLYRELIKFIDRTLEQKRVFDTRICLWDPSFDLQYLEPWLEEGYRIQSLRTMMYTVPADESQVMWTYRKHFRNQVRQSLLRGGLLDLNTPVESRDIYELCKMTYGLGGTHPRYSMEEIAYVLSHWSNDLKDVYLCKYEGKLVGVLISLKLGRVAINWLNATNTEFRHLRPNNLLYHELVRQSIRQGIRTIDFGGQVTAGHTQFKGNAGGVPTRTFSFLKSYGKGRFSRWLSSVI